MTRARPGLAAMIGALASGCAAPQGLTSALPGGTVFQASVDPAQYRSTQPRDAPTRAPSRWIDAKGESCRTMLSWPVTPPTVFLGSSTVVSVLPWASFDILWGNDGYRAAMRLASESVGGGTLFDVRADMHTTAILGIWRRECIEVHALAAK